MKVKRRKNDQENDSILCDAEEKDFSGIRDSSYSSPTNTVSIYGFVTPQLLDADSRPPSYFYLLSSKHSVIKVKEVINSWICLLIVIFFDNSTLSKMDTCMNSGMFTIKIMKIKITTRLSGSNFIFRKQSGLCLDQVWDFYHR